MDEILARAGIFQGVEPSAVSALTKQLQPVDFPRGHTVFAEGEPGDRLYIIITGKVKIVALDEDASTLDAINTGDIYGTVVQDPYNYGFRSVEILAEIARTGDKTKAPKEAIIPIRVIVKESGKDPVTGADRIGAKQFAADLKKLIGK